MFTPEELQKVEEHKSHYPEPMAAIMGVLHMYQDKYGYISDEGAKYIADLLHVPVENILGVITFYDMYHRHPLGKHVLHVCTNVSCLLCGSDMVQKTLRERLGIGLGETTPDKMFTIHEAECLGSCGTAPMISVNKKYHENLNPEKINALIDALIAQG